MATYKPLQSITLTSNASSVTFSGIPQDYTDLMLVSQTQQVTSGEDLAIRFNNDSTSIYSRTYICGDGSTAHSGRSTSQTYIILDHHGTPPTSTSFGSSIVNIPNYSNATLNKTVLNRNGSIDSSPAVATVSNVGLWRSTSAITSITVLCTNSSNLKAGSTFDLYGIKSGAPQALGGDTVATDGNYWYHTFRSTQTFTPLRPLTVDYLVVAGGGGGGFDTGGGGGAGGVKCTVGATGGSGSLPSALSVTSGTPYTITVGGGGAGSTGTSSTGSAGTNSIFSTITSTGGGGGGSNAGGAAPNGLNGGSGGGGGGAASAFGTKGTGSSDQGFNGADGNTSEAAGGGGGAAEAGNTDATSFGGDGRSISITGSAVFYGGGGGGGKLSTGSTGGDGGGGNGAASGTGASGTANTGGGGGGGGTAGTPRNGGAGGSGIVIVRYAV